MAYKSKNNRNPHDEDDYVYPSKRPKENARNRRHSANLIKDALIIDEIEAEEDEALEEDKANMDEYCAMLDDFNKAPEEDDYEDIDFYFQD